MPEWYVCPYCGVSLPTWDILQGHIAVEHPPAPPPPPPPSPPPVYTCPQCGAQFASETELTHHIAIAHPPTPPPPPPPPPEPEPPKYVALPWIGNIWSFVWDIAALFLSAYQEVSGWIWPFHYLQYPLYGLYRVFKSMLTPIATFWLWAEDMATKVVNVWTSGGILGLIQWWFPWLYNVGEWFYNRWQWFTTAVGNWWDSTKTTVLGWIDMAVEGFDALIVWWDEFWKITWPQWMANLEVFQSKVDDFFKNTLPGLFDVEYAALWWAVKLLGIEDLIDTAFLTRQDFWEGWQDLKAMVAKFYQDPLEFLWELFTDWFLGPEE